MVARPSVALVICTRDRPVDLARCLSSVKTLDAAPDEVLVVDQSETTVRLLGDWFKVHRTEQRGLSRARNEAIRVVRSDIVAFVDDDCTVAPDWTASVRSAFVRHPDAALVFGQVCRAFDDSDQYFPEHIIHEERRLRGRFSAVSARGLGAAMCLRKSAVPRIGLFDVQLGAGARFQSSEDWDYVARALAAGSTVVDTPSVIVTHYGGRRYSNGEAARLLRANAFSHGVVHSKLIRCGEPAALALFAAEILTGLMLFRPLNLLRGQPTHGARLTAYMRGLFVGASHRIDRHARVYA